MKRLYRFLLVLFVVAPACAQVRPVQEATDDQVAAGTDVPRYVNPRQYQLFMTGSSPTNGITAAQLTNSFTSGTITPTFLNTTVSGFHDTGGLTVDQTATFNSGLSVIGSIVARNATNGANQTNFAMLNTNGAVQYGVIGTGLSWNAATRTLSRSLTPWTSDIDAGRNSLTNAKAVTTITDLTVSSLNGDLVLAGSNSVSIGGGGVGTEISIDDHANVAIFADPNDIFGGGITFDAPGDGFINFLKVPQNAIAAGPNITLTANNTTAGVSDPMSIHTVNAVNVNTTNLIALGATNSANQTNFAMLNTNGAVQYGVIGSGLSWDAPTRTLSATGGGGGGTSFNTNGIPNQVATVLANGSVGMTNFYAPLGYYTNGPVFIDIVGNSIAAGSGTVDSRDLGFWLTNLYLPPNFTIRTNAAFAGNTLANVDTGLNAFLATWIVPGSNNLVIVLNPYNDAGANDSADTVFSHVMSINSKIQGSNALSVITTATEGTTLLPDQRIVIADVNRMIRNATNINWKVEIAADSTSPPNDSEFNGGIHPRTEQRDAYRINQALLRGMWNWLPPAPTPQPPGYVNGSTTAFSGPQAIGSDGVIHARGLSPYLYLFEFFTHLFYIAPEQATKIVHFGYNPNGHTFGAFTNDMMQFLRNTNVSILVAATIPTNNASITPQTPLHGIGPDNADQYTNNTGGRAILSLPYYLQYSATGSPAMTVSNRMTGKKYVLGGDVETSRFFTNSFLCPPCSPGDVWDVRNESHGTAAGAGFPGVGATAQYYPCN